MNTIKVAVAEREHRNPIMGEEPLLRLDPSQWAGMDRQRLEAHLAKASAEALAREREESPYVPAKPERYDVPPLAGVQVLMLCLITALLFFVVGPFALMGTAIMLILFARENQNIQTWEDENYRDELAAWQQVNSKE